MLLFLLWVWGLSSSFTSFARLVLHYDSKSRAFRWPLTTLILSLQHVSNCSLSLALRVYMLSLAVSLALYLSLFPLDNTHIHPLATSLVR